MADNSDEQSPAESGRHDATGEFFSVGTPLHAVRAGYIRRRADELIYEAAIAGRYAHIIAPDRSGKSSLIAATAARLENNGAKVAILDLGQIGVRDGSQDAARWYYNVAYRLLRQLRIRYDLQDWWQDKSMLSNRQRLFEFYAEIILQNVSQDIVVFVDEIQCIASLPFGDQLLASIRSAHNARTTDPDFNRLTFILLGECDPLSLVNEPELSPFNATQPVPLDDFSREDLNLFVTELNMDAGDAYRALDRIYHWTRGQPYLSQKLARAVAREQVSGDIEGHVDRIVHQQLAGRAALHSEPHMSHIHREIVSSGKMAEGLLNLYGKLRKGMDVPADLGSPLQRRLMAVGLIEIDESGELAIRNRIYETVFTARWANENLGTHWRVPAIAAGLVMLILLIPFWYTQWLPSSYVDALTSTGVELPVARTAWINMRSFPGHTGTADRLYRNFLEGRAGATDSEAEVMSIADMARELPQAGAIPRQLLAEFWDRRTQRAMRAERRDEALLASIEALVLSNQRRRNRSAMLVGGDYPQLLASSPPGEQTDFVFNPGSLLLTAADGARVLQWSLGPDGLTQRDEWRITALEVTPLVRRVIVDREGDVRRIGLTLNISHPRMSDLRIKLISPSGRTVEVDPGVERASSSDDLKISGSQLAALQGESLLGTWSVSVRDEATGVAGYLAGWNLTLNAQAMVEDFQRGLSIPDPIERETDSFWTSKDGRYAVARATQSDSARLWDLAFAKPIASVPISENEQLIGIDAPARRMITATIDTVNIWETATGKRIVTLPIGSASGSATLTRDGQHLFVQYRSDIETRLQLWDLDAEDAAAELIVAGAPALVAVDAGGGRIAVADYDRAVRIWDFRSSELLAQIDLPLQPSHIEFNASGEVLAAVYGSDGMSVWNVGTPNQPMLESFGEGLWQIAFSESGARFVAGRPSSGYQLYETRDGRLVGPAIGAGGNRPAGNLLGFSKAEDVIATSGPAGNVRFWQMPVATLADPPVEDSHAVWAPAADAVVAALPDRSAIAVGDRGGHVHLLATSAGSEAIAAAAEDISFIGHNDAVRHLSVSSDGQKLASVGADNTVRVWDPVTGLPASFITAVPGAPINRIAFSTSGRRLGLLAGNRLIVMDTDSGELLAELELGEVHNDIGFAEDSVIYLGSNSGSLNIIDRDSAGVWNLRRMWTGAAPIARLEVSPAGRYLVIVDRDHLAQLIDLRDGEPGGLSLQLPSAVEDMAFSPDAARVLFSTARWVHQASASRRGMTWLDSLFVPKALYGATIVFGEEEGNGSRRSNTFYLPVAREGLAYLARFRFSDSGGAGLFGNKDQLIEEWRGRLALPEENEPSTN